MTHVKPCSVPRAALKASVFVWLVLSRDSMTQTHEVGSIKDSTSGRENSGALCRVPRFSPLLAEGQHRLSSFGSESSGRWDKPSLLMLSAVGRFPLVALRKSWTNSPDVYGLMTPLWEGDAASRLSLWAATRNAVLTSS